jgi:hypothetical protein
MKNFNFVLFMLLISASYGIFVWWFFDKNQAAITNGKSVKCGAGNDSTHVIDTAEFNPIVEHSRIRKK